MKPYFPKFRNTYCTNSLVLVLNEVFQYSSPFLKIHKKNECQNELHGTKISVKNTTVP